MRTCLGILLAVVSLCIGSKSIAADYYVNAVLGNDQWTGTAAAPAGAPSTHGPWRTLARVGTVQLQPGDRVHLACGQTWRETLRVNGAGNAQSPILVTAYPLPCTLPPTIDGSAEIPGTSWVQHALNIFRTSLNVNLIPDSGFRWGITGWKVWSANSGAGITHGMQCTPQATNCIRATPGSGTGTTLVSSPSFRLENREYVVAARLRAAAGTRVAVIVRRDGNPWEPVGITQSVVATGSWQHVVLPFRASGETDKARLDFEIAPGQAVDIAETRLSSAIAPPVMAFGDGQTLPQARHPNPGHNPQTPESPYLLMAADADTVPVGNRFGSTFSVLGADLALPPGAVLTPGIRIRTRTNAWMMDERAVTSVSGNRLYLDSATSFPLRAGWGYLLTNALWMLDSPGEWHFDPASNTVYVWLPNGGFPSSRLRVASLPTGIELGGSSFVIVDGLAVKKTATAVRARGSSYVTLRRLAVEDTAGLGIDATTSTGFTIEDSSLLRTGSDAISGVDPVSGLPAHGMRVLRNEIQESGVRYVGGRIQSLPLKTYAAVRPGSGALVAENRVIDTGYMGIWVLGGSQVLENYVEGTCAVLDDCGAIYTSRTDVPTEVSRNLVYRSIGNLHGKPSNYTQAQGLYFDDHGRNITALDNTIVDADHGVQLHNAAANILNRNVLYGNRRYQLWLQENSNGLAASGDIFGNQILNNLMIPLTGSPSLHQESVYSSTAAFANYGGNRYSALILPTIALETSAVAVNNFTFEEWRVAATGSIPRNLDSGGSVVTLGAAANYRIAGPSLIANGNLESGPHTWASWHASAQDTHTFETCTSGRCVSYISGPTTSLLYTSHFSVQKDQWYRIAFDLRTAAENQAVVVGVRRGGGGVNGYEWLTASPLVVSGTAGWKRYAIVFKATKSVNAHDPVTLDAGARLDFALSIPGQRVWVDNAEVVPLTPVGAALKSRILMNPGRESISLDCPDQFEAPEFCSRYLRYSDGAPVAWPYPLPRFGSAAIYSTGDTLLDSDRDGIGDIQDACPNTPVGSAVNAAGCAINQPTSAG